MTFLNPANRYAVEVYGRKGWLAMIAYPTLNRARDSAAAYIRAGLIARVVDMVTGAIVL